MNEPLLTAVDLAKLWKVSRAHLYRLSDRSIDPLPCHRLGGVRRYSPSKCAEWLGRQGVGEIRVKLVDVEC